MIITAPGLLVVLGAAAQASPALELLPCRLPGVDQELRCGVYQVWENRAARAGRRIPLRVVLLPALGPAPEPDPLVILEGGPGASNVAAIGRFAATPLRHRRHLLFVDARGTGSSAPLDCAFRFEQPMGFLRTFLPLPQIRACRDSLARHADLTQYVTPNVVDDLDDVRQALGIPQVTLWGSSGGTRQALVW
ncbi:MAG TPA: alpha/beta fold hydrolase, partial [Gemmatimonadales bacterium]|nr:alpha/beta fold hydrolase [Gemmatimonadales bacterium]